MQLRYYTADIFTDRPFGGNQLAVFPDGRGLSAEQMLAIAREFNYSETTFVLPPVAAQHARCVRIFTPGGEVPFAGHPTVGTAHVLAAIGDIPLDGETTQIVFEERVGPVPVTIRAEQREGAWQPVFAQLSVAKLPEVSPSPLDRAGLAEVLSLAEEDLASAPELAPEVIDCGLPFLLVPLRDRDAVRRARVRIDPWERTLAQTRGAMVMVFARGGERPGSDIRARMFAPGVSVPEDPATGSACATLGGYLAARSDAGDGTRRWVVEQGFEMGRPSIIDVQADVRAGRVTAIRVGGSSVMMCKGKMTI